MAVKKKSKKVVKKGVKKVVKKKTVKKAAKSLGVVKVKHASESDLSEAVVKMQKVLSNFNLADAYYIVGLLKIQTEMQMLDFEE